MSVVVVMPEAVKAASFGANTVNGPVPLRVVCRFAFITAASRMLKEPLLTTTSVIVLPGSSSFLQLVRNTGSPSASTRADLRKMFLLAYPPELLQKPQFRKITPETENST